MGSLCPIRPFSLEEMAERKHELVYFFKFPDLAHMIELEALGGLQGQSHFVQLDYSVKIEHAAVSKFLNAYAITGHSLSNGGHAHPEALAGLIGSIAPKAVITLHSRYPESQDTRGVKPYFPVKGETVTVSAILEAAASGVSR